VNDDPIQGRGAGKLAMTWPLQSDTPRKIFLGIFLALVLVLSGYSAVCSTGCDQKCPKANGTPICEPVSFVASANLSKRLLFAGEGAHSELFIENLESNLTLSCAYTSFGADNLGPFPVLSGERELIANESFSAPQENPGYQQIIPISYQVRCSARIVNASAPPEADYLWCGASCQEFSAVYQYPTNEELYSYQQEKLSASGALSEAILAVSEARKLIEKAEALILSAGSGVDTAFAEYRLLQANALLDEAMIEYGGASYSFDQAFFQDVFSYSASARALANSARALANEAYSSLVYSGASSVREYLGWYVNATGIMISEIEELINSLEPIADAAPEILGGSIAMWQEDLLKAKEMVADAEALAREGKDSEALALLKEAQKILLKIKESIEKTFERVYTELLKIAIVSHAHGSQSADNFEKFVKESASVEGVNKKDFSGIFDNIKRARALLDKAQGNIRAAENATTHSRVRKEVNLALIRVSNARLELSIGAARYRIAQFKIETLIAAVSVLAALASIGIIFFDLFSKERKAVLEIVKNEAVGNEEAKLKGKERGGRRKKTEAPALESLDEKY